MKPKLDAHSEAILEEYRSNLPLFNETAGKVTAQIKEMLSNAGIIVAALESRVKTEGSLAGKLELKGSKYASLADITDILGLRVITFYIDDVDKVASGIERYFEVDWENSVDKRKLHEIDSFGYLSLHYICRCDAMPYRFEVQIRTVLQHAWANMNHDTGYKSGVEVPREYLRNLNRLAGMLELVDEQFSRIRTELTDYRRRVQALVASGDLDDVLLDGDTFRSYLDLRPFDKLNQQIAAITQAELHPAPLMPYLKVLKTMKMQTLGDVERMMQQNYEDAYQLALYQLGSTDIDILAETIGLQNLCVVYILKAGGGWLGVKTVFDMVNGANPNNEIMAKMIAEQAQRLSFMNK